MSTPSFFLYCNKAEIPDDHGFYLNVRPETVSISIDAGDVPTHQIFLALVSIITSNKRNNYGEITLCRRDGEHYSNYQLGRSVVLYAVPVKALMERVKTAFLRSQIDALERELAHNAPNGMPQITNVRNVS